MNFKSIRFIFLFMLGVLLLPGYFVEAANLNKSGGGGHTIKDEGSALTQRAGLNFVGDAITCTDDAGNDETDCQVDPDPVFDYVNPIASHNAAGVTTSTVLTAMPGTCSGTTTLTVADASSFAINQDLAISFGATATKHRVADITNISGNDITFDTNISRCPEGDRATGTLVATAALLDGSPAGECPPNQGGCATFDGNSDSIDFGVIDAVDPGLSDWTSMVWVKTGTTGASQYAFTKLTAPSQRDGWGLYIATSTGRFRWIIGRSTQHTVSTNDGANIADDAWHHIALVADRDGNCTRYVDGASYGTVDSCPYNGIPIDSTGKVFLGQADIPGGQLWFNGELDGAMFVPKALSLAEVQTYCGWTGSACDGYTYTGVEESGTIPIGCNVDEGSGSTTKCEVPIPIWHDDAQALRDAIATGKHVYLADGKYMVYTDQGNSVEFPITTVGQRIFGDAAEGWEINGNGDLGESRLGKGTSIHIHGPGNTTALFHIKAPFVRLDNFSIYQWRDNASQGDLIRIGSSASIPCGGGADHAPNVVLENLWMTGSGSRFTADTAFWNGIHILESSRMMFNNIRSYGWGNYGFIYDAPTPCGDGLFNHVNYWRSSSAQSGAEVGFLFKQADYNFWNSPKVTRTKKCYVFDASSDDVNSQLFVNPACENADTPPYVVIGGATNAVDKITFRGGLFHNNSGTGGPAIEIKSNAGQIYLDHTYIMNALDGGILSNGTEVFINEILCKNNGSASGDICVQVGASAVDNIISGIIKDMSGAGEVGIQCDSGASGILIDGVIYRNNTTDLTNNCTATVGDTLTN